MLQSTDPLCSKKQKVQRFKWGKQILLERMGGSNDRRHTKILFIREFAVNKKMLISQQRKNGYKKSGQNTLPHIRQKMCTMPTKQLCILEHYQTIHTYLTGEISKERVTVLCCVSMSGEKHSLLVNGKSQNPCCFKGVK